MKYNSVTINSWICRALVAEKLLQLEGKYPMRIHELGKKHGLGWQKIVKILKTSEQLEGETVKSHMSRLSVAQIEFIEKNIAAESYRVLDRNSIRKVQEVIIERPSGLWGWLKGFF